MKRIDARIPVYRVAAADAPSVGSAAARLVEGGGGGDEQFTPAGAAHPVGCFCCGGRSAAAEAFSRLFLRRARGELDFSCVLVTTTSNAGRDLVTEALDHDRFVAARFRAAGGT